MGLGEQFGEVVNPGLARVFRFMGIGAVEATGEGAILVDEDGNEYIDCAGGYGVMAHGYRHPRILVAAHRQLDRLPQSSRVLLNRPMIELAQTLKHLTPGDLQYSFFCNSGTEAVEAALKIARAATGRTRIISTHGAFHGKTLGALTVSGRDAYREPFYPLIPDVDHVAYGDSDAVARSLTQDVAAVIVEPIQGEGGIIVPPDDYLKNLREMCDNTGALLIADEVQTGLGRTGQLFAVEHSNVVPDLLCLAKSLGGGVMPIGAVVGREAVWHMFDDHPLLHTSTFGGNPLACAVASEALKVLIEEDLAGRARRWGPYMMERLTTLQTRYPRLISAVRGRGLMLGMEVASAGVGGAIIAELFRRHVLAVYTLNNERVIRFIPPLVITQQQIDAVVQRLSDVLGQLEPLTDDLL